MLGPVEQQPHYAVLADAIERHVGEEAASLIRSPYALGDRDLLTGLLTGAGYTGVHVETATRPVVYASHEAYARSIIAGARLSRASPPRRPSSSRPSRRRSPTRCATDGPMMAAWRAR